VIPLFTPGPVSPTQAVLSAQGAPPIYHLGSEYGDLLQEVTSMLGEVLGTTGAVHCIAGSGTAALEMAMQNTCRPGDRVVVASNGYFGERLAEMAIRLALDVEHVAIPWSEPLPPAQLRHALAPGATAVLAVHHETSTGRVNDLGLIAQLCRKHGALSLIDAVSSAGAIPIDMDRHDLDIVVATSQKGVGGTPGLGVLAASAAAWHRIESLDPPPTYAADWARLGRAFHRQPAESLWTPPISVMTGLHAALTELTRQPSLATAQSHRAAIGRALRAGLWSLGFMVWPSGAADMAPITVAEPSVGLDADELASELRQMCGVEVGGGQGQLAGQVMRISHLGLDLFHVYGLLGALRAVLADQGGVAHSDPAVAAWRAFHSADATQAAVA
jgi:serine---pyruvate transaminase